MPPPPPKSRADPYRPIKSSTLKTSLKFDDMLGAKPKSKSVAARLSRARHRWGRHSARAPFAAAARKLEEGVILVRKKQKSPPIKSSLPQQEEGAPPPTPSQSSSQSSNNSTTLTEDQWGCDCMLQRLQELKEEVAPGSVSFHPTFECPEPLEDTAPDSAAMMLVKARRDFTAGNHKRYLDYLWNKTRGICNLEEKKKQADQAPEISSVEAGTNERNFCRPPHLHYSLLEVMTMRRLALKHSEIRSRCEARRKFEQAKQQAALRKSKKKVAGESKQEPKPSKKMPASEPAPAPMPQRQPPPSATDPQATREAVARISGDRMQPQMLRIYEMFYKRGVLDKLTQD